MPPAQKVTAKSALTLPDGRYLVEPQLYLVVRRGGLSRTYFIRYTLDGRRRDFSLGSAKDKTLAVVKAEAAQVRSLLARGIGPKDARDRERAERARPLVPTFAEYVPGALDELKHLRHWAERSAWTYQALANIALRDAGFASRRLDEITVENVKDFLTGVWDQYKNAHHLRGLLEMIFTLARRDGFMTIPNPALWRGNLDAYLPLKTKERRPEHFHAISLDALRDALRVLITGECQSDPAIIFLALTACRRDEVLFMRWSEVDFDTRTFSVPPERRKDRRPEPHVVPLSDQALALLAHWKKTRASLLCDRRFASRRLKKVSGDEDATLHGMRSTFRDWCAETGKDPILAEKSLMHATGNAVQQAYQRSDLLEQRRPLMQAWADTILPMDTLKEVLPESMNTPPEKY